MELPEFQSDNCKLETIIPHVYHLSFKSSYDLAMHFIRFQEYYESPKFHKQFFTLVDYMEWYAKDYERATGAFTYPRDWHGFNVPSHCLIPFLEEDVIPDRNKYDDYMLNIIRKIQIYEGTHPFYLIGTQMNDYGTLDHELAHALYTVNNNYHEQVAKLLQDLPPEILENARTYLKKNNYHQSTIDDEIHAYCATGLDMLYQIINDDNLIQPFVETFQKYKNER